MCFFVAIATVGKIEADLILLLFAEQHIIYYVFCPADVQSCVHISLQFNNLSPRILDRVAYQKFSQFDVLVLLDDLDIKMKKRRLMALEVPLQSGDQHLCWPFEESFLLEKQVPGLTYRMILHPQQQLIITYPPNYNRFLRHNPFGLAEHERRDLFLRVKTDLTRIAVPIVMEVRHIIGAKLIVFGCYSLQLALQ